MAAQSAPEPKRRKSGGVAGGGGGVGGAGSACTAADTSSKRGARMAARSAMVPKYRTYWYMYRALRGRVT